MRSASGMREPLIERRELPARIEVKIEPAGRTCRVFKITERGLGELANHAARLEAGAHGKGVTGVFNTPDKKGHV